MTLHVIQRGVENCTRKWTLREHVHRCSAFPAPHNRVTIHAKVLQQVQELPVCTNVVSVGPALRAITYDAASSNAAFEECVAVDKQVCVGHRLNTLMEHLFKDCAPWADTCALVLGIGLTVKNSTMNRQELQRVQLA